VTGIQIANSNNETACDITLTQCGVEAMTVWQVQTEDDYISFGGNMRKKLRPSACNEPFRGHFWCPRKKWFFKEPCPFLNKHECLNYRQMCGSY
jgi:hypothetical protein